MGGRKTGVPLNSMKVLYIFMNCSRSAAMLSNEEASSLSEEVWSREWRGVGRWSVCMCVCVESSVSVLSMYRVLTLIGSNNYSNLILLRLRKLMAITQTNNSLYSYYHAFHVNMKTKWCS